MASDGHTSHAAPAAAPRAAVRCIGVVGGGQLAAMLTDVAVARGIQVTVLDPTPGCPAAIAGAAQIIGDLLDAGLIERLAAGADVTTVDLEHVNAEALARLADSHRIVPAPHVLATIADKLAQKRAFDAAELPTSRFAALPGADRAAALAFGLPAVQKAARGGYDGRGVAMLHSAADLDAMLPVPGFIEAFVEHDIEIGVMVARAADGAVSTWPVTEMHFNAEGNLLDYLVAPARVAAEVRAEAAALAVRAVQALDGVGIFGVEMFLTGDGRLLLNEMAPRTHNCGHYTIDACATSQFAQQLHLLVGEPLGPTRQYRPAAMVNLLGAPGFTGKTVVEGAGAFEHANDVHVHLYGKIECRALRKMGHLTALGASVDEALARAREAAAQITIRGADPA